MSDLPRLRQEAPVNVCPRCGTSPVDVTEIGSMQARRIPACVCWPRPPSCPTCRQPLAAGRCSSMDCPIYDQVVPVPDVDPLYVPP